MNNFVDTGASGDDHNGNLLHHDRRHGVASRPTGRVPFSPFTYLSLLISLNSAVSWAITVASTQFPHFPV